jgi:hypothetical protein
VLFWLRLPLSEDGKRVDRILCYDVAAPMPEARAPAERPLLYHQRAHTPARPEPRRAQFG